jgi:hypothetical protein
MFEWLSGSDESTIALVGDAICHVLLHFHIALAG